MPARARSEQAREHELHEQRYRGQGRGVSKQEVEEQRCEGQGRGVSEHWAARRTGPAPPTGRHQGLPCHERGALG